jgi:hypothetical protein
MGVQSGQREYVDYRNPPAGVDFNLLNQGDPVAGRPGYTWGYDVAGGGWYMAPAGGGTTPPGAGPGGQIPVQGGPPPTPTGQEGTREYVDYRNPPEGVDFNRLNLGDPVANRPGYVWGYDIAGGGWFMTPAGSNTGQAFGGGPGPGGTPAPGTPGAPAAPAVPPDYRDPALPPQNLPPGEQVQGEAPQVPGQPPGPPANTPQSELQQALQQSLMEQLGRGFDVNVTDPEIAAQANAYRAARTRSGEAQRSALAERLSAQGLDDSGLMDTELRSILESQGQDIAEYEAGLVGEELTRRREDIRAAMGMAQQQGQFDQAERLQRELANIDAQLRQQGIDVSRESLSLQRDLGRLDAQTRTYLGNLDAQLRREGYSTQERLAQLDAEVRRLGINTQGNLGALDIALRRELGIGGLNLGLLEALMQNQQFGADLALRGELGRGQLGLGQGQLDLGFLNAMLGNQQFYDDLGFRIGAEENDLNQALYAALGG